MDRDDPMRALWYGVTSELDWDAQVFCEAPIEVVKAGFPQAEDDYDEGVTRYPGGWTDGDHGPWNRECWCPFCRGEIA